ncbi:MAG TPA: hypothetical protein VGF90_08055 [Verrucomicrobiae bacterium]
MIATFPPRLDYLFLRKIADQYQANAKRGADYWQGIFADRFLAARTEHLVGVTTRKTAEFLEGFV